MTVIEELRRSIEAEGLPYKVVDITPPMEIIEAGLTEADREYLDFIRYAKVNSRAQAVFFPAPEEN